MTSRWHNADFSALIRFLGDPDTDPKGSGSISVALPWDLRAEDYLGFARTDLRQGSAQGRVNALANAKRALRCQIDSVLFATGFWPATKSWTFPCKEDILVELGFAAPAILTRTNRPGDGLEQEYSAPQDGQWLADFVDAVELFIASTARAACRRYNFIDFDQRGGGRGVEINFDGTPKLTARLSHNGAFVGCDFETSDFEQFRALQCAVVFAAKRSQEIY